jgi:acyl transferase domain-containing protein
VERLEISDGRLRGVRLRDGRLIAREAIVVGPRMVAASPVLDSLGLKSVAHPMGSEVAEVYEADPSGATAVKGVWVAGNVYDIQAQGGAGTRHAPATALRALAGAWAAGADVDWTAAGGGGGARKVALPTYPFQRQRSGRRRRPGTIPMVARPMAGSSRRSSATTLGHSSECSA